MTETMNASTLETLVLREYSTYADAQRLVDRLSDGGFPVERVRIVGDGLHTVEQVTGRMTKGRAALYGVGGGAWFGLLIGLLLSMFAAGSGVAVAVLGSLAVGAFWGALFGFVAHWATGGDRDFSSVSQVLAKRYTVQVEAGYLDEAKKIADWI
ncbi:MAG: general stress protein [Mycobacterium sp.]